MILMRQKKSKKCIICHFWFSLDKGFKFQPQICNRYHDVWMMSVNLRHITVFNIAGANY